ncbi:MAG: OmpH/Skp family outer membrane protein [Planctomycetota bacterium]|jgi:Skp family chaperone for outer membrane proteins
MQKTSKEENRKGYYMKVKTILLSCLTVAIVLSVGFEHGHARADGTKDGLKIGVLSVRRIFRYSQRVSKYRRETTGEREMIRARLDKLAKEIEAEEAGLKMLDPGSDDYLAKYKQTLQKRADLETEQKFYNQRISLKEQKVTEELYKDILEETNAVAKEKGLQLVLEKSEPELPASSPTQLELFMGTHKVLYTGDCQDLTQEVMARIDSRESKRTTNEN